MEIDLGSSIVLLTNQYKAMNYTKVNLVMTQATMNQWLLQIRVWYIPQQIRLDMADNLTSVALVE